jgi:hypothetical protein
VTAIHQCFIITDDKQRQHGNRGGVNGTYCPKSAAVTADYTIERPQPTQTD